jgi:hypothetical protein
MTPNVNSGYTFNATVDYHANQLNQFIYLGVLEEINDYNVVSWHAGTGGVISDALWDCSPTVSDGIPNKPTFLRLESRGNCDCGRCTFH